jgi:hypothetical protein
VAVRNIKQEIKKGHKPQRKEGRVNKNEVKSRTVSAAS